MGQGWYEQEVGRLLNINEGWDCWEKARPSIKVTRRVLAMVSFQKIDLPVGKELKKKKESSNIQVSVLYSSVLASLLSEMS